MRSGYRHTGCQRIRHDCAKGKRVYRIRVINPTCFTVEYTITEDPNQRANNIFGILFGLLANKHINGRSAFGANDELLKVSFRL